MVRVLEEAHEEGLDAGVGVNACCDENQGEMKERNRISHERAKEGWEGDVQGDVGNINSERRYLSCGRVS